MEVRAAFEKWMDPDGKWPRAIERNGEGYALSQTHSYWTAWSAALAAMPGQDATIPVERAVEIIDKLCHENDVEQRAQFRLVHAIRKAAPAMPGLTDADYEHIANVVGPLIYVENRPPYTRPKFEEVVAHLKKHLRLPVMLSASPAPEEKP